MKWQERLAACNDNLDRALLARDLTCDQELLKVFCLQDLDPAVVEEAALNPNSNEPWVHIAIERFPELNNDTFWRTRHQNKVKEINRLSALDGQAISGDRDQIILKHIYKEDNLINHANSHLGKFDSTEAIEYKNPDLPWAETSKYRVALVMAPAWGILFPPYNLAKLVGMIREHGYSAKVYDANIESYHLLQHLHGEDYWRGERYFLWTVKDNFNKFIMPYIKPLLDKILEDIITASPKVVGFSIYNTNVHATTYLVKELRSKMPDVCILGGGPEVATTGQSQTNLRLLPFNYLFVGEAEETLLSVLENLPTAYPDSKFIGTTDSKLKLESYAYPDYSDYRLSNYMHRDGVSIETSRGCVAQCSFCAETYFWKFRSTGPEYVVEEMQYQIKKHGIHRFWFVDSLVNGNIKNFERLIDLIIEKKLNIRWNSYARCDGRMDRAFIQKIADSGCSALSYGVESGSQKVLHDMRKKIEIWEIESNLRDGSAVGVYNHANWMIGFPTEDPIDFLHSLTLVSNVRKYVNAISPGFGAGPASASHMQTDWKVYSIVGTNHVGDTKFLNGWYTENYKNTILHRFIRIKMFHVWLDILESNGLSRIDNSQKYSNINEFFKFTSNNVAKAYVEYDNYVKLDRLDDQDFANSIANEYFTIAYSLYQYFGEYSFELIYDPIKDKETFGTSLVNDYTAKFTIAVDANGEYSLELTHTFNHRSLDPTFVDHYNQERSIKDQSFGNFSLVETGNFKDWVSSQIQTKETVHEQYQKKSKKVIEIVIDNG